MSSILGIRESLDLSFKVDVTLHLNDPLARPIPINDYLDVDTIYLYAHIRVSQWKDAVQVHFMPCEKPN